MGKFYFDKQFINYSRSAKSISLDTYAEIFMMFCEAYHQKVDDYDLQRFKDLAQTKILDKSRPEGFDYRPKYGDARLFITPNCRNTRLYAYSYLRGLDPGNKILSVHILNNKSHLEEKL